MHQCSDLCNMQWCAVAIVKANAIKQPEINTSLLKSKLSDNSQTTSTGKGSDIFWNNINIS